MLYDAFELNKTATPTHAQVSSATPKTPNAHSHPERSRSVPPPRSSSQTTSSPLTCPLKTSHFPLSYPTTQSFHHALRRSQLQVCWPCCRVRQRKFHSRSGNLDRALGSLRKSRNRWNMRRSDAEWGSWCRNRTGRDMTGGQRDGPVSSRRGMLLLTLDRLADSPQPPSTLPEHTRPPSRVRLILLHHKNAADLFSLCLLVFSALSSISISSSPSQTTIIHSAEISS